MVLVAALLEREKRLEGDVGGIMSVTGWVGDVDETMVAETEVFFVLYRFIQALCGPMVRQGHGGVFSSSSSSSSFV